MAPDHIDEIVNLELSRIERLADAWRGCLAEVEECIFWISDAVKRGKVPSAFRVKRYLEYVRMVSGYEAQMTAAGVVFHRRAS